MTTTATRLRTIALHWRDLHDTLGSPATIGAFGLGLRGYLAALEDHDAEYERAHAAHLRAQERDPIQLGERPAPLRIPIFDTMRAVENALVECADITAAEVQRSPMGLLPKSYPAADRTRRELLAMKDAADPRRWRYTGTRTAPIAALWLLARVKRAAGPFTPLDEQQQARIATVAASAADRVERALDIAAQRRTLERRCACGGAIDVYGGEGRQPLAHCDGCGGIWTEGGVIAA